jgi:hypothetical protein
MLSLLLRAGCLTAAHAMLDLAAFLQETCALPFCPSSALCVVCWLLQASCGAGEVAAAQLSETLRRLGRAVTLAPPDPSPALEAGLRGLALRDCSDAARAVSTVYRLAAMQLLPRYAYWWLSTML